MTKHAELKNQLKKETGISYNRELLTARQLIRWLKDHKDSRLSNIGYGLEFGIKTGRLPNTDYDGYLLRNYKRLTNLQLITLIAKATLNQTENTTAAACNALQAEFGIRVR